MASSIVEAEVEGLPGRITIQGFREGEGEPPYVLVAFAEDGESFFASSSILTPENAHILGEELRKHAEFAQTVREQGEK